MTIYFRESVSLKFVIPSEPLISDYDSLHMQLFAVFFKENRMLCANATK
jgi:hypothetical protein